MKITQVELCAVAANRQQFPREVLPEIALVGRSNVGKSSLINALLNQKNLARTSSVPGRTQLIFFYKVNEAFFLVDLPGYGFAKTSKELWARVRARAESYFQQRGKKIRTTLVVLDAGVGVSPLDKEMLTYLSSEKISYVLILNKVDKVSQKELHRVKTEAQKWIPAKEGEEIILFSAKSGLGKDLLWRKILRVLNP
jgi:GTP-binding protein